MMASFCDHCMDYSFGSMTPWFSGFIRCPLPNDDMPEEIRLDYMEARDIASRSPRGAAALLRLCVEKLCAHLGRQIPPQQGHR